MAKLESQRSYSMPDAEMLQASRIMNGLFVGDKALFTGFDNSFADPFAENWLTIINDAENVIRDDYYEAQLTEKTSIVRDKMEECKSKFQKFKYFIEKAFPGKKEIWNQFGFDDYDNARKSEVKMIQFLSMLSNTSKQYKAQLNTAGLSDDEINSIEMLQAELKQADLEQEKLKKQRPAQTQERITLMNNCYTFMQRVSRAGKIIFVDNAAKFNQYLMPGESTQPKEEPASPVV